MEMKKIMSSMLAATMVAGMAVTPIVGERIFGGAVVVAEASDGVSDTNNAPEVKSGSESQKGNATPASNDKKTEAVKYTVDVSTWFEDKDSSDVLTYSIVTPVDGAVLDGKTLTYTPDVAQAGKPVEIVVKANDGTLDSKGNVTVTITVGEVPADKVVTPADPAIGAKAELSKIDIKAIELAKGTDETVENVKKALEAKIASVEFTEGYKATVDGDVTKGEGNYKATIKVAKDEKDTTTKEITFTVTVKAEDVDPAAGAKAELSKIDIKSIAVNEGANKIDVEKTIKELAQTKVSVDYEVTVSTTNYIDGIWTGKFTVKGNQEGNTVTSKNDAQIKVNENVIPATVSSIEVASKNHKTQYTVGEKLDVTNIKICVKWDDDTEEIIVVREDNISGFDSSKPIEKQPLTIEYSGKKTTFDISIKEDKPADKPSTGNTSSHKKSKRSSSNTTSADKVGSSVSNPTPSVKEADANKAVEKALEAAVKVGDKEAKAEVVFENVKEVAPDVFKAIADKAAKQNGVDLSIKVHMDSVENGKTTARMYINPQLAMALKNPVNTLISTSSNNADNAKTTATFTKYFKNETAVVSFDQKGDFGMKISAAVKVDLAKLNTKALKFYSYDTAKNTYKLLADTNQFVDVNGYLHFDTVVGNTVVITDSPLESK